MTKMTNTINIFFLLFLFLWFGDLILVKKIFNILFHANTYV